MKVRYTKLPDVLIPGGYSWYPMIQVCARYGNKGRVLHALVDSGAVDCIFPASIGEVIGIDVPSGEPKTYFGLAEQSASGFVHSIQLQVTGFNHWINQTPGSSIPTYPRFWASTDSSPTTKSSLSGFVNSLR